MNRTEEKPIAQDHIETDHHEEDLSFLDDAPEQDEAERIGLAHAALLDDLRSLQADILRRKDRLVYYAEPLGLADIENLTKRIKRILTDFSAP